ncbi:hypothetical protein [Paraburkholderia youngii]|uniref:hypothetical protein n=1 Tax=Paraburkholderia youngii TaxID=2782701 RepID=UPI003D195889
MKLDEQQAALWTIAPKPMRPLVAALPSRKSIPLGTRPDVRSRTRPDDSIIVELDTKTSLILVTPTPCLMRVFDVFVRPMRSLQQLMFISTLNFHVF